jgi:hypothetical protein
MEGCVKDVTKPNHSTMKRQLIGAEMHKSLGASEVPSDGAYPQGDL